MPSLADHYNISTSKGKVAKFSIFKHNYKIGDDVIGLMDFSDGTVPCLKVSRMWFFHAASCACYLPSWALSLSLIGVTA